MINYPEIQKRIDAGLITCRKHPTLPLEILNYTQKVQFDKLWDKYTMMCRGLILDANHNIVARPFPKFFNLGETPETMIQNLPNEIPKITEKYDGCFLHNTALNLWNGGTINIKDVVNKKLHPTLMGMKNGKIIPCNIIDWFKNGTKNNWLAITLDCNISTKSGMGKFNNILRVTDNHHICINNTFQPAINAKIGDSVTSFELCPDINIIHVIESGLLGDGSLQIQGKTAKYYDSHKKDHEEYTQYIREWLGNSNSKPKNIISGFGTCMTRANSKYYRILYDIHKKWYRTGKKIIPKDLSWIDDFTIAKWYMDDGSLSHNDSQQDRAIFSTNGFEEKDVRRLSAYLSNMYNIDCTSYNFKSKGWSIHVNVGKNNSIDRFWTAITPHIVPIMRYKIPLKYHSIPYISHINGKDNIIPIISYITNIRKLENSKRNFPSGRKGFDIKTSTGNYFAKGILVHNSLGILYPDGNKVSIATRGAFESPQAAWATNWIRQKGLYSYDFMEGYTYLFEIICDESKNVVDYKGFQGLILIAVISNKDGTEEDAWDEAYRLNFRSPQSYQDKIEDIVEGLKKVSGTDSEGVVCKYSNGLRVKIKSDDYKRLHKILSGFSEMNIWEALSQGKSLDSMAEIVPDEFYQWIKDTEIKFLESKNKLMNEAKEVAQKASILPIRKNQADYIMFYNKTKPRGFSGLVFNILDDKTEQAEKSAWNMLKP